MAYSCWGVGSYPSTWIYTTISIYCCSGLPTLGLFVAMRWLVFCKPWPMTHNSTPFLNYYMMAHLLSMMAYAGVTFLQLVDQSTMDIAVYVLPGFASIYSVNLACWF